MNWEKAKTLTIIFLLTINAFLASLVYSAGRKYSMTTTQDLAIAQYMSRNSVSLYTTIPRNFKPMAALRIQPSQYSATALALAFFGSIDDVGRNFSGDKAVYDRGNEVLEVEGDSFEYENKAPSSGFAISRDSAVDICEKFILKHEKILGSYVLDRTKELRNGYSVTFNGKFRDRRVTSNTLVFHITEGGISRVSGVYNTPLALTGEAREIISPDEALYLFVKYIKYIYDDQEVLVNAMDLVYYLSLSEMTADSSIPRNATPYYRFRFMLLSGEAQIMINAYTGVELGGFF